MKISIYSWGGHPVKVFANGCGEDRSDIKVFKSWENLIVEPANDERSRWLPWISRGECWLEGPSSDFQRRLLLRYFYEVPSGERGLWSFWGCIFPIEGTHPSLWASFLSHIVQVPKDELEHYGESIEWPDKDPPSTDNANGPLSGKFFEGTYPSALRQLETAIAGSSWDQLRQVQIACHPPKSLPGFTTVIRSDGFPLGRVSPSRPQEVPPRDKQESLGPQSQKQRPRTLFERPNRRRAAWLVLGFIAGYFVGFMFNHHRAENKRLKEGIEKLKRETKTLKSQIDGRNSQILQRNRR